MIVRTRLIITALLLSHLFLHPALLTSQLRSSPSTSPSSITAQTDSGEEDTKTEQLIAQELQSGGEEDTGPQRPAVNVPLGRNEVLIRADEQEKNQDIYNVRGHVEIRFGEYIMHADQATYDSTTGALTATGHVVFEGGPRDEHLVGSRATYDVSRDTGKFYDVTGSTGVRVKNRTMFLASSTPFFFAGAVAEKLGPDRYRVSDGYVTSCQLPTPKWQLDSRTAYVELGNDAVLHHAILKLHGIPVFYFPFVEHPVDNLGRKSGFLIPEIGNSTTRGFIFGDGFYWVLSRNADATLGAALYSARGWAQFGDLRAIGYTYGFQAQYYGVIDNEGVPAGQANAGQNQGGQELKVDATKQLPYGFQGTLSVDYLSSYVFRLAFALSYTEAINSEVRSAGFVQKGWNGYFLGLLGSSYQNYESTATGDYIQIVHAPNLDFASAERTFSRSNFVYAFDFDGGGLSRSELRFRTAPIVARVDAAPYLAWPKLFDGWTVRPQVGARETYYSERLQPGPTSSVGFAVHDAINRNVFNASFELRPPTLSKIFAAKPFGRVLKNTIEPFAIYRYQTGIDNFSQIIRFDSRDILADTNEVEYGFVTRLFAKKTHLSSKCFQPAKLHEKRTTDACADGSGPAGEVLGWQVAQKYFGNTEFGGALVSGRRNVFDSTVDFTGIAFLTEPRRFSPVISRVRASEGAADLQWDLDYDPVLHQINASAVFAGYRWGNWYLNGGQSYVNAPGEMALINGIETPNVFDQWRFGVTYGAIARRGFSGAFNAGVDSQTGVLQAATVQTNYNWDCCGIAFQYSRWSFGPVRDENAYRFSFSLTNVGTFGSIKRIQRLY